MVAAVGKALSGNLCRPINALILIRDTSVDYASKPSIARLVFLVILLDPGQFGSIDV